jgi:hypothetical protein
LNYENTIFPANFRVVDLLQYKDLLKIHHAFHHTLRRGTEGHGGSIAIKGVVENSPCFADPPKSQCFDDVFCGGIIGRRDGARRPSRTASSRDTP